MFEQKSVFEEKKLGIPKERTFENGNEKVFNLSRLIVCKNNQNEINENTYQGVESEGTTFASTNPFYHLQLALQKRNLMEESEKHNFLSHMTSEIKEMKHICEQLVKIDTNKDLHTQKTLIMDLQNLQSRRANLDEPCSESEKECLSIKNILEQKENQCKHIKCDKINTILEKASEKIEELTFAHEKLKKELEKQIKSKEKASEENEFLRKEIAKLDDIKCTEIQKLKKELEKLKKSNQQQFEIFEACRISQLKKENEKTEEKSIQKIEVSFKEIKLQQKIQTIIKQKPSINPKNTEIKLKNLVYM